MLTLPRACEPIVLAATWRRYGGRGIERKDREESLWVSVSEPLTTKSLVIRLQERDFLVRLLENPTLLEHESFTDLLRAVFHLAEELAYCEDLSQSPTTDRAHLAGDTNRAYLLLVHQWLDYMEYLKVNYPYLFSLAMRTNPFDRQASPIVK